MSHSSEPPKFLANGAARVGAVTYLNARPLVATLDEVAPWAKIVFDLPSRLADAMAVGQLDVAMIPSIEYARHPGYEIISDACIACDGPVWSVKLYGRVPIEHIRTLALDEGSRTSAALTRVLLKERFGVSPATEILPIGETLDATSADAVLLIGDRAINSPAGEFAFVWDLGEEWLRWTGLPFVFALWIARPGAAPQGFADLLAAARDRGLDRLGEIAKREAPRVGISESDCLRYLRDHLKYHFGDRQRRGLERYYALAGRLGLAPQNVELVFHRDNERT